MWIVTTAGFYSIVKKPTDPAGKLTIRSRVKTDLVNLKKRLPGLSDIIESDDSDYRYRAFAKPEELAKALSKIVVDIDYSNFKNRIEKENRYRATIYSQVWGELMALEHEDS